MLKKTTAQTNTVALDADRLERITPWGRASYSMSYVYRPTSTQEIRELFQFAKENNRTIGLRAGGKSYGDASSNSEDVILNLKRMNRVLEWNPRTGIIVVEPGLTVGQLWQYAIEDGWFPPVVTGTMHTTIGGIAAVNAHGKNAWRMGTIGEHIQSFDLLIANGDILTCSKDKNTDIYHAAIGGFGVLGVFVSLTIQMKRIYSGLVNVEATAARNLSDMMAQFDNHLHDSDYLVGWIDCLKGGKGIGRGEIHRGTYLMPEEDPIANQTLRAENQQMADNILGIIPKSQLWRYMQPFWNNWGMRLVNGAKYYNAVRLDGKHYQQPIVEFQFLLDSMPGFSKAHGKHGLIQYQVFLPKETAESGLTEILKLQQKSGLPNYLGVLKRHKPDPFLISYSLDGYSMAQDFRITARNRQRVVQLCREMDEIVLRNNGRFYFAKDSTLRPNIVRAYLGEETIGKFLALKNRLDPDGLLQTDLYRRLFL